MPFSDNLDPPPRPGPHDLPTSGSAVSSAPPPADRSTGIADGREQRLDPKSIPADRLGGSIRAAIFCCFALIAVIIVSIAGPFGRLGALLLAAVWFALCAGLATFVMFWPPVRYRYTSYRVSEEGIRIRRGVVWRLAISVPRSRVQHTDVSRGPIERAFDLATLIIYTAGTQHASVHLPGLAHETALAIRDHLIGSDDDDAV